MSYTEQPPAAGTPTASTPVPPAAAPATSTPPAAPLPPAGTAAYLAALQGYATKYEARLLDQNTHYNRDIAAIREEAKSIPQPDVMNKAGELNQRMQRAQADRDADYKLWQEANRQVNAELDRQQQVALKSTTLTQQEKDALSAQQALAQRQRDKIDAEIQQEAARFAWEMDPNNLEAKRALDASVTAANEANTRYTDARTANEELDRLYGPAVRQAALDSAFLKNEETKRTLAAGGPEAGVGLTRAQIAQYEEQTRASAAQRAVHEQELKEHQLGTLGTFIDQVTATAQAGLITQAEAERQIAAFASAQQTGATPYEWQAQADTNARAITQSILQSGQATAPGQQYMVGAEPGGILEQAAGQWGFTAPNVPLNATSAPAYMQSLNMTTGQPPPAGAPPVAGGAPAYAASLPPWSAQPSAQGALPMGVPGGLPDYTGMTRAQVEALHGATALPLPGAQPPPQAAPSNVVLPQQPPPLQPGAAMGGVNNGLALSPIITGAPNYARITP